MSTVNSAATPTPRAARDDPHDVWARADVALDELEEIIEDWGPGEPRVGASTPTPREPEPQRHPEVATVRPEHRFRRISADVALREIGREPLDSDTVIRYQQMMVEKHTPPWTRGLRRTRTVLQWNWITAACLLVVILIAAIFYDAIWHANPAQVLALGYPVAVYGLVLFTLWMFYCFAFASWYTVTQPYWNKVPYSVRDNLVPAEVITIARHLTESCRHATLELLILSRENVILDPILRVDEGGEYTYVIIWDENGNIVDLNDYDLR